MMNKKKTNVFDIILNIILVLLSILIIYWFIQLIFGGSPGLSEFNFALIALGAGFLVKLYREMGEVKVEIKYISTDMKHMSTSVKDSFNKIKGDMDLIKNKLEIS